VVISAGYSVVIDGTFLKRWQRDLAYGLANDLAVEFEILDFDAPVEMLRDRILKRASDPSDATLEVLDHQIAEREPLVANERCFVRALGSVDRSQY
jgi:predicted kinase